MPDELFKATRRIFLGGVASVALVRPSRADALPVRLGVLVPLTGSGGIYGQSMAKMAKAVVDEVNAAGGIGGRQIALTVEDDQTSTDASVRGVRKLIDVDKVAAVMGTYTSAGTMAIAPLCYESKTSLATISGADSITQMPTNGFLIRTQPNTTLQGRKFGEYAISTGAKRVYFVSPQTPFAQSQFDSMTAAVKKAGGDTAILIYDDKKPSYRSEVDEALRFKPDAVVFGGYTPDTTVMLKEFFRASYSGGKIAFGYSVNDKLIAGVPPDVVEGTVTISPSPAEGSPAYKRMAAFAGTPNPDPYTSQIYDHANLIILALAAAGSAELNGQAIKDNIRKVSQGQGGTKTDSAVDGMKLLAAGRTIDYDGASGPCDFTETGDIVDCRFRYDQVKGGKLTLLRIA